jgi:alkylation response protein AidB-like acyl-CoA dehydrogenase
VVLARDPNEKHRGITLMLIPLDQPGVEIRAIWTMGDERTNEVFIEDVFVPDDYVVGEVGKGFQYISRRSTSNGSRCSPSRRSTSASSC